MTREDFDDLSQDLLGRPVTAAEFQALLQASTALRLAPGSPVVVLLILFQALRTEVASATADRVASEKVRAQARRRARIRGYVTGALLGLGCGGLGYSIAVLKTATDDRAALHWVFSEEGARARRLSETGLFRALEACSIPGWYRSGADCFPGPDPATGAMRGIRISP